MAAILSRPQCVNQVLTRRPKSPQLENTKRPWHLLQTKTNNYNYSVSKSHPSSSGGESVIRGYTSWLSRCKWLGHLKTKQGIQLVPFLRPISMRMTFCCAFIKTLMKWSLQDYECDTTFALLLNLWRLVEVQLPVIRLQQIIYTVKLGSCRKSLLTKMHNICKSIENDIIN